MKSLLGASVALFVVSCLSAIVLRGQEPPAAAASTVWDKVYTEAQATRGKDAYMTECSACHSEDLGGSGYAPALKGDDFTFTWNDKSVGDFFDRVRKLMCIHDNYVYYCDAGLGGGRTPSPGTVPQMICRFPLTKT